MAFPSQYTRRHVLQSLAGATALAATSQAIGQEAKTKAPKTHPLDPALELARDTLAYIREHVNDYECNLRKRERIGTQLKDPEVMFARIRNRKTGENDEVETPLSVYLKFLQPEAVKGQEVLWVEGKNGNKLLGHQGGLLGRLTPSVRLDPKGPIAMRGNLHPITDIGIENLVIQLIDRGERDRKYDEVNVEFQDAEINERKCTLLEVTHPLRRPHFDFNIARIYVDKELKVPVMYEAYSWPEAGSTKPVLLEQYAYLNLKLNVGLDDTHFDEHNKAYGFH